MSAVGCLSGTQSAYNQGTPGKDNNSLTKSQSVNESDLNSDTYKDTGVKSTYHGNPSNGGNGALQ